MRTLSVRADAGVAMGTGHVMRCLALAQAWQDEGGDVLFAMAQRQPAIEARLRSEGVRVVAVEAEAGTSQDVAETIGLTCQHGAHWVVVDGYQFDAKYQAEVKGAGLKVLFVDDSGHSARYSADLVLNQNAHAHARLYESREPGTRLLLGTRYALLRREFRSQPRFERNIAPSARKLLVTMGGSDPHNLTQRVTEAIALLDLPDLEATVIVGGANPHAESLRAAAARSGQTVRLLSNVDNMSEWMRWADVAISAAGSTCWEMCFLGLPAVLLDFAPNQTPVARELSRLGAALHFGDAASAAPEPLAAELRELLTSPERRTAMAHAAVQLVDGKGAERVVGAMAADWLCLRRANAQDCRLLWEWANDPEVRRASFSSEPIPWDDHVKWFTGKLADPKCHLFVAYDRGKPVGQIRLDETGNREAEIDVSVAGGARGQGYAARLIFRVATEAFQNLAYLRLHAFIRSANLASVKAFERAHFSRVANAKICGQEAFHYVLERAQQLGYER